MRTHHPGVAALASSGELQHAEGDIQKWMRVAAASLNWTAEDLRHDEADTLGLVHTLQDFVIPARTVRGAGRLPFAREVIVADGYVPGVGSCVLALNSIDAKLPDGVVVCDGAINAPEAPGQVLALEFFNSSTSDVFVPGDGGSLRRRTQGSAIPGS